MVDEGGVLLLQALLIPACASLRAKENLTLIVIHAVYRIALVGKKTDNFTTDQTAGTSDKDWM